MPAAIDNSVKINTGILVYSTIVRTARGKYYKKHFVGHRN